MPLLWLAGAGLHSLAFVLSFARVDQRPGFPLAFSVAVQLIAGLAVLAVLFVIITALLPNQPDAHPGFTYGTVALTVLMLFAVPQKWTIVLQPVLSAGAIASVALTWWGIETPIGYGLPLLLGALWFSCLGCAATLASRRPAPTRIAEFYVCMGLGTPLGAFMLTTMPTVFPNFLYEYPLLLVGALLVRVVAPMGDGEPRDLWPRLIHRYRLG